MTSIKKITKQRIRGQKYTNHVVYIQNFVARYKATGATIENVWSKKYLQKKTKYDFSFLTC